MKTRFPYLYLSLVSLFLPLTTSHAEDRRIVRFGATMSLTGSSAPWGQSCVNGITLATEDVNKSGGIGGATLEVAVEDFGDLDLKRAVTAAHKFLSLQDVVALLPNWSEDTEVIAPIAEKNNRIVMTLGAGGPGASRFSKSTFRATTSDGELARQSAKDELAKGKKNACLFVADSSYYVDIAKDITEAWTSGGGKVVSNETIEYNPKDVRTVVTKLRRVSCDTIFVWSAPAGLAPLLHELKHQGIKGNRVLPWFAGSPEVLNETVGDTSQQYIMYRYDLRNAEFIERFKARFGQDPMRPAGNCYDGIRVLSQVMNAVGTDRDKVREALLKLSGYVGVTGPFIIRADREREGEPVVKEAIENGKVVTKREP